MLWVLRPVKGLPAGNPWDPWYDRCFGMVVRASSATEARLLAGRSAGPEGVVAWENKLLSSCEILKSDGASEVVIQDIHQA
jgi:hypothetical protein